MDAGALGREWTAFGGASLALMGGALGAGAARHAADARAWEEEHSRVSGAPAPVPGRGFEFACRAGGALLAAAGIFFAAAAQAGRAFLAPRLDRTSLLLAGALVLAAGLGAAALKILRRFPRGPRFLKNELLITAPKRPFGERAADAAAWALCALWTAFGARLLSVALR